MDKTGAGTQLELVMCESHISDTLQGNDSPASDIQVSICCSVRLYFIPYFCIFNNIIMW